MDFNRAIAVIPSLAIHLDRKANEGQTINKQTELSPLLFQLKDDQDKTTFADLLKAELQKQKLDADVGQILDYEMFYYDINPPALVGLKNDFIAGSRIDNLASCYLGLQSLLASSDNNNKLLICNDHEECGSNSYVGAAGPLLKTFIERICKTPEAFGQSIYHSMMISCDNAHAVHPNYSERHDENHGPIINQGPVIKINNNQRYATNSTTSAIFSHLCNKKAVPYQKFVSRNDQPCGSTIGPITATLLGIKTIDIGLPTFGMHSIRELAGSKDSLYLFNVLNSFLSEKEF